MIRKLTEYFSPGTQTERRKSRQEEFMHKAEFIHTLMRSPEDDTISQEYFPQKSKGTSRGVARISRPLEGLENGEDLGLFVHQGVLVLNGYKDRPVATVFDFTGDDASSGKRLLIYKPLSYEDRESLFRDWPGEYVRRSEWAGITDLTDDEIEIACEVWVLTHKYYSVTNANCQHAAEDICMYITNRDSMLKAAPWERWKELAQEAIEAGGLGNIVTDLTVFGSRRAYDSRFSS